MRRLLASTATAAALLIGLASFVAPALAVPGPGAGSDTPGTSATVTTRSLPVGGTIGFHVSGFPAGEVVYVKIDDGRLCSASATHGACVVHQQRLDARGAASGSFVLPSDVAAGKHWLRFLASQEVAGGGGGVKGYTARGTTDFTVTAASTGGDASGTSGQASDAAAPTTEASSSVPSSVAAPTAAVAGEAAPVAPSAGATLHVEPPTPAATVTVTATPSAQTAAADAEAAAVAAAVAAREPKASHPPYIGIVGLLLLVALAAGLLIRRVGRSGA